MQKKLYTYTTCLILLAILREEVFAEEILPENIFAEFKFTILHQHSKIKCREFILSGTNHKIKFCKFFLI